MSKGLLALSPLLVFVGFYLTASIAAGDFYRVPITVPFMVAGIYAVAVAGRGTLSERIATFSRGAGADKLLLMLWIYVLAGAFAASARGMGSIDATVALASRLLPAGWLLPGMFVASCFISLSIGTSVGTIVALVPIAVGMGGEDVALITAATVGGAYFGDNLSFISDTTVVATQTQGCRMSDKFRANALIVIPVAVVMVAVYAVMGHGATLPSGSGEVAWLKVVPYIAVLVTAVAGANVMAVLVLGTVLSGATGIMDGSYDVFGWLATLGKGVSDMGELVIIAMLAGGLLETIRARGGIDFLIRALTAHVSTRRGAELSIAALVGMVGLCTANNTVAILTVGQIARRISERFGVEPRRAASILDTTSCAVQGLLPYGVQMLLAAGLAGISPMQILPYLYYPMAIGAATLVAIWVKGRGKREEGRGMRDEG